MEIDSFGETEHKFKLMCFILFEITEEKIVSHAASLIRKNILKKSAILSQQYSNRF